MQLSQLCTYYTYVCIYVCVQANNTHGCQGGDPTAAYSWILANGVTDDTCSIYIAKNEACTPEDICRNCDPFSGCFAVKEYKTVGHASSVV